MHKLLTRQMQRVLGRDPVLSEQWERLLALVSEAYTQADADRTLLERSLDLTSQELLERNRQLQEAHAQIDADYARLTADLHLAQQVQRHLIPTGPYTLPGLRFHSFYRPASAVGGDYFDCITSPAGHTLLLIGDVTGKGAAAAML